jgi:hypothetical protein
MTNEPKPTITRIFVDENIVIDADIDDGWIAIVDTDNLHYDEFGALVLGLDQVPALVEKLLQLLKETTNG